MDRQLVAVESRGASGMMSYKSMFGGGDELTPAQHLAEGMCARQARRDRVRFDRTFWRSPMWNREYRRQMEFANDLLKKFAVVEAIVAALRTEKGRQVYSLGLRSVLVPLIKQVEQERSVAEAKVKARGVVREPAPAVADAEPPRPPFVLRGSLLSKLREL
jgi:hypothetical protein